MRVLVAGFQSGEFSPLLEGRTDLAQAGNGCRKLRNMIPRALGGAFQRPGFLYAGLQRNQAQRTRLLPFTFSTDVTYRIELGVGFARFWIGNVLCIHQPALSGPQYLSVPGEPLVLATPYTADEAFKVQFAQANDVIWLTHPNHLPRRLIRYGEQDWRIEELPLVVPPLRDPNALPAVKIAASATTGAVTLTATGGNVFDPGDVGGYYEIAHRRDMPVDEVDLNHLFSGGNYFTGGIIVSGKWEVFTYGKWAGTVFLEQLQADGTWEVIRTWISREDFNAQSNGEVEGGSRLRVRVSLTNSVPASGIYPRIILQALDSVVRGLVKITGYTSPTVATGTVTRTLHATTATKEWSEGSWSPRRGYPRAVTLHGQRIIFAGNRSEPQTVWGSSVSGYDNFERTTLEDAGFVYQIAATQANSIVWLVSQRGLLIGTEGDEWIMDGGTDGQSITAQSVRAERRSGFGSDDQQAMLIGSAVVFVQNGGRVLNEYLFDFQQQGFEAIELTELAEHFGDEGIVQFAYAQNPHSIIYAVTEAGSLLSLTYKRRNQTLAWAKHTTPHGLVESVCCTPSPSGIHEVWVSVVRTIEGVVVRTIERADTLHWDKVKAGTTAQLCMGDGGVVQVAPGSATITGLDHLNGAQVGILVDGAIHPSRKVLAGAITLEEIPGVVVVGLPVETTVQPMPVEVQMDTGSSFGRRFRVPEIDVKLWQSGGQPTYSDSEDGKFFDFPFRNAEHPTGAAVPLFTGIMKLPIPARHRDSTAVLLRNNSMLPLNILSMVMQVEIHGT